MAAVTIYCPLQQTPFEGKLPYIQLRIITLALWFSIAKITSLINVISYVLEGFYQQISNFDISIISLVKRSHRNDSGKL